MPAAEAIEEGREEVSHLEPPLLSDATHRRLLEWAAKMVVFLSRLTSDRPDDAPPDAPRVPAMPLAAFRGARGLAFSMRVRHAALLSYTTDVGFLTRRIEGPDGAVGWSPPLFFRGAGAGLGLSLGWMRQGSCFALMNEEAVRAFSAGVRPRLGANARFLVNMDGARPRAVRLDSTALADNVVSDARGGLTATYFRLEAFLVDFSLRVAGFRPAAAINAEVYGAGHSAEAVLAGRLPAPAEFRPVMAALERQTAAAARAPGLAKRKPGASPSGSMRAGGVGRALGASFGSERTGASAGSEHRPGARPPSADGSLPSIPSAGNETTYGEAGGSSLNSVASAGVLAGYSPPS